MQKRILSFILSLSLLLLFFSCIGGSGTANSGQETDLTTDEEDSADSNSTEETVQTGNNSGDIAISSSTSDKNFFDYVKNYDFSEIDNHALSTPSSAESSISELASYLTQIAENDLEKARAIFRWIAENISYDTESYFSGRPTTYDADAMLISRKSVCEGYSNIFKALCDSAGIECVKVSGYAKGYGFEAGDTFEGKSTNHAWNAVKLDGEWYLLDSTWGAGHLNGSQYEKDFQPHYFLTPPEQFIYDHLPEDPKWQLLDDPITQSEYSYLVYLRPAFFSNGLQLISHKKAIINTGSDLQVEIAGPSSTLVMGSVDSGNNQLSKEYIFIQQKDGKITVDAVFPSSGEYKLQLYAKSASAPQDSQYDWALDYAVNASEGKSGQIGFPTTYGTFTKKAYLYYPKDGYLKAGTNVDFKIEVNGAEKVAVVIGDNWNHLNKSGDTFSGKVSIPSANEVVVYAQFPGQGNYSGLLMYKVY